MKADTPTRRQGTQRSGGTIAGLAYVEPNDFDRGHIFRHHHSRIDGDSIVIASIYTTIMCNTSAFFAMVVFVCPALIDESLKGSRIAKNPDGFR